MISRLSSFIDVREKRAQFRRPVPARVRISHSTFGIIQALTRDISDTGVFIELRHRLRLPIGAHIKLQFLDSVRPEIAFNMKVIRDTEEGIALTFVDFELAGQRYRLEQLRDHWQPQY